MTNIATPNASTPQHKARKFQDKGSTFKDKSNKFGSNPSSGSKFISDKGSFNGRPHLAKAKFEGKFEGKSTNKSTSKSVGKSQDSANQEQRPVEHKSNAVPFNSQQRLQKAHQKNERIRERIERQERQPASASQGSVGVKRASSNRVFNKAIAGDQPITGIAVKTSADGSTSNATEQTETRRLKGRTRTQQRHFERNAPKVRSAVGSQSRAAAAKLLDAVASGRSLTDTFPKICKDLDDRDKAFVKEIVFGTLRQRRVLMTTLQPLLEHQLGEKHRIVQYLLISALYQLVFLQNPPHAVVAATVSACEECGQRAYASMVNAILRRFLREKIQLATGDSLAVQYSFPDWLADRVSAVYSDKAEEVLSNSNVKPPMILRVENSKISTEDFLEMLKKEGIAASLVAPELSKCAVILNEASNVYEIPGFAEGLCTVQDLSAQLAAPLLDLNSKDLTVLDCCCAPGGKTAHILDLCPECKVTATDVDEERLHQTQDTLDRLKRKATLQALDGRELSKLEGMFDRILVDAPCSGTGVIRRHPDIKWLRREKDIAGLAEIQAQILDEAFNKLKVGGKLLYTTCSILPEENIEQIQAFLKRHANARLEPFKMGDQVYETCQRLPGEQNGDGFFYARITKLDTLA